MIKNERTAGLGARRLAVARIILYGGYARGALRRQQPGAGRAYENISRLRGRQDLRHVLRREGARRNRSI